MSALNASKGLAGAWRAAQKCASLKKSSPLLSRLHSTATPSVVTQPSTEITVLDNGIRVATESGGFNTATVGVYIDSGSRYEAAGSHGAANLVENMVFQGTNKRTKEQLAKEVHGLGAHFDAHTSREQSSFSAKCLSSDVSKVMEILGDILQNPKLGDAEIEQQRAVILRQMQEAETDMRGVVSDHLHAVAYQGTPLGRTVLGSTASIMSLSRDDLAQYINTNFKAGNIVVAGAGAVDHAELCKLTEQHFGKMDNKVGNEVPLDLHCRFTGSDVRARDDSMPRSHVAIAMEGCGWASPDRVPLMVASTLIGSWDETMGGKMSASNLVRFCAETGNAHCFQPFNTSYKDSGLWGIYFSSKSKSHDEMCFALMDEWMRICTEATGFEVERAKNQLMTDLLLQSEGTTQNCNEIGRQMLSYGKRISQAEMEARIKAVDAGLIREVCSKYIYDKCPVVAAVGPIEDLIDYTWIRRGTFWYRV